MFWKKKEQDESFEGTCPAPECGKQFKTVKALQSHARKCRKYRDWKRSYYIPIVALSDISALEIKPLAGKTEGWGIWNNSNQDWLKTKNGEIDSRLFRRNMKPFLNSVVASSIIADGHAEDGHS